MQMIKMIFLILFRKNRRLIFTCSRYEIKGKFVDVNVIDLYSMNRKSFVSIETFNHGDYFYILYCNFCQLFKKYRNINLPEDFVNKVNKYFNINLDDRFFQEKITSYQIGLSYYKTLFKAIRPKSIFFVQNGIHKDWINAAKSLNIPIVEIQHGEVGVSHAAYHYPMGFNEKYVIAADYFLVWSEFWKNRINYPGVNVIPVGNSYYFTNEFQKGKVLLYDFVIISNTEHQPLFDYFLQQLLNAGYTGNICYKLHPEQIHEYEDIRSRWKKNSNIDVVLLDKNAIDTINESHSVLAIHSTVVFQALDMNRRVILYNINEEYLSHKDIFDHPNLHIVSDVESFLEAQKVPVQEVITRFYEDFNRCKFEDFMAVNNL